MFNNLVRAPFLCHPVLRAEWKVQDPWSQKKSTKAQLDKNNISANR